MPRKTKDERIRLTREKAIQFGLPERHSEILAKISFRRKLDSYILELIQTKGYIELIENYHEMQRDPTAFYYKHKSQKVQDNKRFTRYGNLSYMYSNASPIQIMQMLLEDAKEIQRQIIIDKELEIPGDKKRPVGSFFECLRFSKLEQAFFQDLTGNGIPPEATERILKRVNWEKLPVFDNYGKCWGQIYKEEVMQMFYNFFGSKKGDSFLEKWKDESRQEELIEELVKDFYSRQSKAR